MALSLARSPHHRHLAAAALPAARISRIAPLLRIHRHPYPLIGIRIRRLPAAAVAASSPPEAQAVEDGEEEEEGGEKRRKLYVANIPWSFPAPEIEKLFAQCGAVKDVEVIKGKDGKKKGFAFVTMATAEEAAAAVEKLNSLELMGRPVRLRWRQNVDDMDDSVKANGEIEDVNVDGEAEGVTDNGTEDHGEDKQD